MKHPRYLALAPACVVTIIVVASTGCSGGAGRVVARVGGAAITTSTVAHRLTVLMAGETGRSQQLREKVLDELIAEKWLKGELARDGIHLTAEEIRRRIQSGQESEFPGGREERATYLRATGQVATDLRDKAVSELATEKLRQRVWRQVAEPTAAQVGKYYTEHRHQFFSAEKRILLINNRKHESEIRLLRREVEHEGHFARESLTWTLTRPVIASRPLERAIYAARPNVLNGPVKQLPDYFLFEVKDVIPARYQALSEVAAKIRIRLTDAGRRAALAKFVVSWRARWRARTHCRAGYVVPRCSEYDGVRPRESGVAFT